MAKRRGDGRVLVCIGGGSVATPIGLLIGVGVGLGVLVGYALKRILD
jgi:hypothetical protein